jgi:RNA polymerase sigma-70 factor (ECF subfamily)
MADTGKEDVARWLAAAHAGCRDALGQALDACRNYLLRIAEGELDSALQAKGGASDLVQETFLEAHRDFAQFQGATEDELRAWLRQLLLHNLGHFTRRYRQTAKRAVGREVQLGPDSSANPLAQLPGDTSSPSVRAAAQEKAEALERALERLPEDYRQVIALHHRDGRPFEEIAALMQRSVAAVRKLWSRAIDRLQQELETRP